MAKTKAIAVFTARGVQRTLDEGGSMAWVLDARRARKYEYVVCVQNYDPDDDWGNASASHGTAFLVGRLEEVVLRPAKDGKRRWLLKFSEYARIDVPSAWPGHRNPVLYTELESFGIRPEDLKFYPMPASISQDTSGDEEGHSTPEEQEGVMPLTIAEAKAGLAAKFGVDPAQIQITIQA